MIIRAMSRSCSTGANSHEYLNISNAKEPDLRSSLTALCRAAELARREAIQTDTDIVVVRHGRLVRLEAKSLREQAETENAQTS